MSNTPNSSLTFDARGSNISDKPDNSPTFFSARQPKSNLLHGFRGYPKNIGHPYRYFLAAGESLAKISEVIAAAKAVPDDLRALAEEVGALPGREPFTFENPEVVPVTTKPRFQYRPNSNFICDASTPGSFYVDRTYGPGQQIHQEVLAIQGLTDDAAAEQAREELAKKYKAALFDGKFFSFADWEDNIDPMPRTHTKQERLKANPIFIRGVQQGHAFHPDMQTDEGFSLGQRLYAINARQHPEQQFAAWINSFELDISYYGGNETRNRPPVEVEVIDGDAIILVPVIAQGIYGKDGKGGELTGIKEGWVMPPGAQPIAISDYYARIEKSGSLRVLPLRTAAAG